MAKDVRTYRATMRGWKPKPGQLVVRITHPVTVEVFQRTKNEWNARETTSGNLFAGTEGFTREGVYAAVECEWEERLTPWTAFVRDANGDLIADPNPEQLPADFREAGVQ